MSFSNVTNSSNLDDITGKLQAMEAVQGLMSADVDHLWTVLCAFLVFSMQIGFTLVEAGSVASNVRSILMKNLLDGCICSFTWWFVGYGFAAGNTHTSFAAVDPPFTLPKDLIVWFWNLSFVATAATIVSGAMAERTKFMCYCLFCCFISTAIYPFVVHWEWTAHGFMSPTNPKAVLPVLDFAGCGPVHVVGGFASLMGAWMVGPRPGAFVEEVHAYTKKEFVVFDRLAATQSLWQVVGVMALWIGWYGFNCGSVGGFVGKADAVGLVAVNTTLGAITGALFGSLVSYIQYRLFKVELALMGVLAGLVSITGSAPWVHTPLVVPITIIGFLVYHFLTWLLVRLRIDDPVSAFPIHGGCGFWGMIAVGLFQDSALSKTPKSWGEQLGIQLAGAVIVASWTACLSLVAFSSLKVLLRGIRVVDAEAEFHHTDTCQSMVGPQGRVTLLFTDIQSSTVLWETDEECMAECLVHHDTIFRRNLRVYDGFEVKTEGDAFMCAFGSATDAAKFCIAVQCDLLCAKWPRAVYNNPMARVEDDLQGRIIWKGLRVRMGFHSGEPSCQENPVTSRTDYFGRDVNYAARVSSAAVGGQIFLSSASVEPLLKQYMDNCTLAEEEPFGMTVGERHSLTELECYVEYIGRVPLKGITNSPENHPDGEHLFQLRPFGLETRQFAAELLPTSSPPRLLSASGAKHQTLPSHQGSVLIEGSDSIFISLPPSRDAPVPRRISQMSWMSMRSLGA